MHTQTQPPACRPSLNLLSFTALGRRRPASGAARPMCLARPYARLLARPQCLSGLSVITEKIGCVSASVSASDVYRFCNGQTTPFWLLKDEEVDDNANGCQSASNLEPCQWGMGWKME